MIWQKTYIKTQAELDAIPLSDRWKVYIARELFARKPIEIPVAHAEREAGRTKYSFYRLIRLNFDLMTGFSLAPLQLFSIAGMLIALGAVIRGETYHFEVVSNDTCRAIMEVQLHTGVPIANGILTCETDEQAEVRMQPKGSDCAQAAVEMANLLKAIRV